MRIPHRPKSMRVRSGAVVAAGLVVTVGLASCGEAATRSTERFCGELTTHATEIQTVPTEVDAIPALITLYSKMAEVAPLEIQADWEKVYSVLKTANTINTADPASVQKAADTAYAADQAARNVVTWAKDNCGVDIGPVAIVPGGADVVATTTTIVVPAG